MAGECAARAGANGIIERMGSGRSVRLRSDQQLAVSNALSPGLTPWLH